jgi:hypothetical protein
LPAEKDKTRWVYLLFVRSAAVSGETWVFIPPSVTWPGPDLEAPTCSPDNLAWPCE